jgi:hypothetical protein
LNWLYWHPKSSGTLIRYEKIRGSLIGNSPLDGAVSLAVRVIAHLHARDEAIGHRGQVKEGTDAE